LHEFYTHALYKIKDTLFRLLLLLLCPIAHEYFFRRVISDDHAFKFITRGYKLPRETQNPKDRNLKLREWLIELCWKASHFAPLTGNYLWTSCIGQD